MRIVLLLLIGVSVSGCSSLLRSRWAMDDPVYEEKYRDGAKRWDLPGKVKQAMDARHTSGLGGMYVGGGAGVRPNSGEAMAGSEVGMEGYACSWATGRASLAALAGNSDLFVGADVGLRLQTPTRIAPFIGVGTFHGYSESTRLADCDGIDNNDNLLVDEPGEEEEIVDGWLSAIYPEVGVHAWINGSWRVTGYGRYMVTTAGRRHDDWILGLQIAAFSR